MFDKPTKKNTPARDGKGCWRYAAGCAQLDSKSHNSHQTKAELLSRNFYHLPHIKTVSSDMLETVFGTPDWIRTSGL